jgi:prepilin-type N-terminal cleavage/methylation domain-containing protein
MRIRKGFTLIELLIVVGLIALVTGLTIPGFGDFVKRKNFERAVNQLLADIQSAQSKSQSGSLITNSLGTLTAGQNTNAYWGVQFICGNGANAGDYSIRYLYETAPNVFSVVTAAASNNLENRSLNRNMTGRPYWFDSVNVSGVGISICAAGPNSIYFDRFTGTGFDRSAQSSFSSSSIIEIVIRATDINETRVILIYRNGKVELL